MDIYELGDGGPMSEEQRADLEELFFLFLQTLGMANGIRWYVPDRRR